MTLKQTLLDIAPEMSNVDSSLRDRLLNYAQAQVGFGDGQIKNLAIAYLAAHIYTMSQRGGNRGALVNESEGDLSRGYKFLSNDTTYGMTNYGQEFARLKKMFVFSATTRQITR